jgi:hypothetical protein
MHLRGSNLHPEVSASVELQVRLATLTEKLPPGGGWHLPEAQLLPGITIKTAQQLCRHCLLPVVMPLTLQHVGWVAL